MKASFREDLKEDGYLIFGRSIDGNEEVSIDPCEENLFECDQPDILDGCFHNLLIKTSKGVLMVNSIDFDFHE
jgi:hypothetical protein